MASNPSSDGLHPSSDISVLERGLAPVGYFGSPDGLGTSNKFTARFRLLCRPSAKQCQTATDWGSGEPGSEIVPLEIQI